MIYESMAFTLADWDAHRAALLADGWEYLKTENGVVYIRRPHS